ncbi:hypothetical protein PC9H_003423 [Pleurotus ostreatus]|uniref:DUF4604 domain-containing protein n=2 Tax=Pleurotus TaxID=5320 RepID=A0A8H7A5U8_PLEOS|nr:uncharacterized protein PC9H_003423 [Pleurotus ostreatus]KAF7436590.1 hypothetical protein PC9H_003423 [Pleurotus ostreatus]KAG9222593.1 hypothetical protein CCMSSC00406_0004507 [Pleurotus cornucopiae]
MAPKEPNRHQLSSRLAYSQNTPTFLRKLQNKYSGKYNESDEESEPEFEPDDGSGRPPIPRRPRERPPIPERPDNDLGSADEDGDDEKPTVVVLKEGKHLTEREAENIRRKEKGLPPLKEDIPNIPTDSNEESSSSTPSAKPKTTTQSLSFSTKKQGSSIKDLSTSLKRKGGSQAGSSSDTTKESGGKKKKKQKKTLLSFGDDA